MAIIDFVTKQSTGTPISGTELNAYVLQLDNGVIKTGGGVSITAYAPIASPALTGTPTAPTAEAGTSTTQLATTEFATNAVGVAIGVGQTWQDVTASRALDTTYTNATTKPIFVIVTHGYVNGSNPSHNAATVNDVLVAIRGADDHFLRGAFCSFIVPAQQTYIVHSGGVHTMLKWAELR